MDHDFKLGQIVRSKAGRDKGRFMIVVGYVGADSVLLADGKLRKIEKAKKKKVKHVAKTNISIQEIANQLKQKQSVTDAQIRDHLNQYHLNQDNLY